jgi:hypothetical protein
MVDVFDDIETIKNVLVAWEEGASDEKREAKQALRKMLQRKVREVERFEEDLESMFDNVPV